MAVLADIAARLPVIPLTGDRLKPAQVIAAAEAIGGLFRRGSSSGGVGLAPKALVDAARDLARAQADDRAALETGSPITAVFRWIETFINPASPTMLDGADRLWTKALGHQRDLDRRHRNKADEVGPVKLALSATYARMLADLRRDAGGKSNRELVQKLIQTAHTSIKKVRAQPSSPDGDLLDLFGEPAKAKK